MYFTPNVGKKKRMLLDKACLQIKGRGSCRDIFPWACLVLMVKVLAWKLEDGEF